MLKSQNSRRLALGLVFVGGLGLTGALLAQNGLSRQVGEAATVVTHSSTRASAITEAEVLAAQQAWGEALVQISRDYETGGIAKAKATAERVIDSAYGYSFGPVLCKPTVAVAPFSISAWAAARPIRFR